MLSARPDSSGVYTWQCWDIARHLVELKGTARSERMWQRCEGRSGHSSTNRRSLTDSDLVKLSARALIGRTPVGVAAQEIAEVADRPDWFWVEYLEEFQLETLWLCSVTVEVQQLRLRKCTLFPHRRSNLVFRTLLLLFAAILATQTFETARSCCTDAVADCYRGSVSQTTVAAEQTIAGNNITI